MATLETDKDAENQIAAGAFKVVGPPLQRLGGLRAPGSPAE
jgi:hypothetical protein